MAQAGVVPQRGDVIWLDFDPQRGREQAGRRPALVLSLGEYNSRSSLCLVCPITNQVKNYPFEIAIPDGFEVTGVVLCDQLKSLDWLARRAEHFCRVPDVVSEVLDRVGLLISPD
jgi:mRNA interferase MazF